MTRPAHRAAAGIALTLSLSVTACGLAGPARNTGRPTAAAAPTTTTAATGTGTDRPPQDPAPRQLGLGLRPPPPLPAASTTAAAAGGAASGHPDRSEPAAVARAFATGLFTDDWTRPLPGAQKAAATRPWATPALAAKLAHGQNYQPERTDPRVAARRIDTVDRVEIDEADPIPGAKSYLATVHLTTTGHGARTTSETLVLLRVVRSGDGWLVEDSQLVS